MQTKYRLSLRVVFICGVIGAGTSAGIAAGVTQKEVIAQATATLEQLVQKGHDGKITQAQLRTQRMLIERRLEASLLQSPIAVRAKEQDAVNHVRTALNQKIMFSQEFEFFGSQDQPEWGWYPSRQIKSAGAVLRVDKAGKATLTPVKP
ncbi:MAG: hypothetical protein EXS12_03205 [Phycisphaerales bacterium]|nr:hypothetical protein [Phycisphaerales bacterium]